MSFIHWRWEERDLGFRFRTRIGRQTNEFYQARKYAKFYSVPASQRKLRRSRIKELAAGADAPMSVEVVPNPWQSYDRDWDWIMTEDGICINWAGCLDREEIERREDEGVQRAMELVTELVTRAQPVPLTVNLLRQIHLRLMGTIYPFAGSWRTVGLHKGIGPERWPLPPGGIQPMMDILERNVLTRSPIISDDEVQVFSYASEVMNEILAVHPFREGNGRLSFMIGNLILMQNDMLPLGIYERHVDEQRYFNACEAGRLRGDYRPLATLLAEWEDRALQRWIETHG
jgi:cell filamentation protein